ncbi:MAG: 1-acyl-sn-glycerol-3-phosphate acyltransferase [Chloroflexi bacterium]|nr:1-acyl-sn-glycerol-3-phosphate acyltransferase [Chloroflexota bacterium]
MADHLPVFAHGGLPVGRRRFLRDGLLYPIGFTLLVKPTFFGVENIPTEGPAIILMNHIGLIDPVMAGIAVRRRSVTPLGKKEVLSYPIINILVRMWGVVPVDRAGVDRTALLQTLALLEAGHCILIAPEGTRHHEMQTLKEGFVYLATRTNAVIVPTGLAGTAHFENNIRKLKRTPVSVTYGPPFRFKAEGKVKIDRDTMVRMATEAGYQIAKLVQPEQRGVYADLDKATTSTLEFVASN